MSNKLIILINVFLSSDLTSCSTGFWRWTTATTKLGTKVESVGTSDTRGQPPELTDLPKRRNSKISLKRRNSKASQKRRKPKTSENWLRRWWWWLIKGRHCPTSMSTNITTMKKWLEWFCFSLLFLSLMFRKVRPRGILKHASTLKNLLDLIFCCCCYFTAPHF